MSRDSRIASLNPEFRPVAEEWLRKVHELGVRVTVLETLRSPERQAELLAKKATRVKVGWHNFGRALDFAAFDDNGVYQVDDKSGLYTKCGVIAETLGCRWGGRWEKFLDYGHIEYAPGLTLDQMRLPEPPVTA